MGATVIFQHVMHLILLLSCDDLKFGRFSKFLAEDVALQM